MAKNIVKWSNVGAQILNQPITLMMSFSSGLLLTPVTSGGSGFVWTAPSGATSTGGTPSPAIDEPGRYKITMDNQSELTSIVADDDTVTCVELNLLMTSLATLNLSNNAGLQVDNIVDQIYALREILPAMTVNIGGTCPDVSTSSYLKIVDMEDDYGHTWTYNSTIGSLIAESTIVGSASLPLTNASSGARKSIFVGESDRLANTVDSTTLSRIPLVSSMATATNLVATALTDWTDAGNAVSSSPSANLYRITLSAGTGTVVDAFLSASNNRTMSCQARLVSGTVPALSVATFRAATVAKGTAFDLTTLTSSFQDVTAKVTTADTTDDFAFSLASGTCVIEIKLIRLYDLSAAGPPMIDLSAAGAVSGVDKVQVATPAWPAIGTLFQLVVPYGYSGSANPATGNARLFEDSNNMGMLAPGAVLARGSGGTPTIATSGSVVDGVASVASYDWNGVDIGARWCDTFSRSTAIEGDIPSGALRIGNLVNGAGPFHGLLITELYAGVKTDAEFEIWRAGMTERVNAALVIQ